jgi:hypothetical protein
VKCLDPDNGIALGRRPTLAKYALLGELAAFVERGQSAIVYQHADRSAGVKTQAARLLRQISDAVPVEPLAAVIARRGSVRMFALIPRPSHRAAFLAALEHLRQGPWRGERQPVYQGSDS